MKFDNSETSTNFTFIMEHNTLSNPSTVEDLVRTQLFPEKGFVDKNTINPDLHIDVTPLPIDILPREYIYYRAVDFIANHERKFYPADAKRYHFS